MIKTRNTQVLRYPQSLDENVSRPIALTVFTVSLTILLRPEFFFLIIPIWIDFIIRYVHPRFSPLVYLTKFFGNSILNVDKIPKYSLPKRFAILIGTFISSLIIITYLFNFLIITKIFLSLLLFAAGLQGFYGYCLGCKIYDYLIKLGFISSNKRISSNYPNLVVVNKK